MPAVRGIDPQGVAVGVDAAAEIVGERQAAIVRLELGDAEHIDVVGVARIDADDAEVHRPRVERVDPLPRLAAVARAIDAAVLVALGPLLVLNVGRLAEVGVGVGPRARRPAGAIVERDFDLLRLVGAEDR